MDADWYQALNLAVTQLFLGGYVILLADFRQPRRTWQIRWLALIGILEILHIALVALGRFDLYARFGVLTLIIPYTFITLWCARYRGMRTVFSIANGMYVGCICGVNGYFAQAVFPQATYICIIVRIISLILLYFILKKFSYTCRQMLCQLKHGWLILCLIPIVTGLATLYTNYMFFETDPFAATTVMYGLLAVCGCAYYLMYLFWGKVEKENQAHYNAQLSALQLSALQSRMDAVKATENTIRTERHDLRHRLQIAAELVAQGDKAAALDFLNTAQRKLDEQKEIRWCRPPVLDAMFSSYFDQAQRQGIRIEENLSLPDTLPVDESELAVVLANALENAIYANMQLPDEQREIYCRMVSAPSLMLEISNPCKEKVAFDGQGIPIARRQGHGLGMQSISNFCHKHGAVCQFEQARGRFRMKLVL